MSWPRLRLRSVGAADPVSEAPPRPMRPDAAADPAVRKASVPSIPAGWLAPASAPQSEGPPIIELRGVTRHYDGSAAPAVRDLSLQVARGEIVSLLGPSGCGKTTILRLIAGFERPDAGQIYLAGHLAAGDGLFVSPERRRVGFVFQSLALFPHLTVGQNVAFGLGGWPGARRRTRVEAVLALTGLTDLEHRYPHEISGGQQQRVALARALAPNPEVILLDEPFSSLDASLRAQMRDEIIRILRDSGATAVLVTHDQADALAVSDRVAVVRDGRIEQLGAPRDIYQAPRTSFVAGFVGQINLFEGSYAETAIGPMVDTDIGPLPVRFVGGHRRLHAGDRVRVGLRPEAFAIDAAGPLPGVVRAARYSGNHVELRVTVSARPGSEEASTCRNGTLGRSERELIVYAAPETDFGPGAKIRLRPCPVLVSVLAD